MLYFLMHEDFKIALFNYENQTIGNVVINDKYKNRLPLIGTQFLSVEKEIANWILNRGIPVTRQGIKGELIAIGKRNTVEYMLDNLGLSLTDHYWICPQDKNYRWKDINMYENDFKARYDLSLKGDCGNIAGETRFIPSASLKGDLKKKWIIDKDGTRRLVKGNYNHSCRQSICELLATEIHKKQNKFPYTPYRLIKIGDKGQEIIGCECPNFTDIHTEFIAAIDIVRSMKRSNDKNYYETYIQYCVKNGIEEPYIRSFLEYQILTDFILTNTDRHFNNFGMIRDSKTLKLLKPAPIFDSGNSMFYNSSYIKVDYDLLDIEVTSFKSYEIELLKYVRNPFLVDLKKLPSKDAVYKAFKIDPYCTEEAAERLVKAYSKKIELLNKLQQGVKIYSYDYLRKHGVKLHRNN